MNALIFEQPDISIFVSQHDVSQTLLKATLDSVVEECVSFVGVDINICSEILLRWVKHFPIPVMTWPRITESLFSLPLPTAQLEHTALVLNFQLHENDTLRQYFTGSSSQFLRIDVILQGKTSLWRKTGI